MDLTLESEIALFADSEFLLENFLTKIFKIQCWKLSSEYQHSEVGSSHQGPYFSDSLWFRKTFGPKYISRNFDTSNFFEARRKWRAVILRNFECWWIHETHRPILWYGPWLEFVRSDFSTCNRRKPSALWYSFIIHLVSTLFELRQL